MSKPTPIYWDDELVGYIEDSSFDQFHEYGRWKRVEGPNVAEFEAAVRAAMRAWDEQHEGVCIRTGSDEAEVTAFDKGMIEILHNPNAGDSHPARQRR
jgi:hypothetical protein